MVSGYFSPWLRSGLLLFLEGWEQTVVDVERLRDEAIALGVA